jgi:hypothetical protein
MIPAASVGTDPVASFIAAACVPREGLHASGTLERADSILAEHPEVARASIHTAAILGDESGVRSFLARDDASATATGGPTEVDALLAAHGAGEIEPE